VTNNIEILTDAGFQLIGHWELDPELNVRFDPNIPAAPGVYAIVANGKVQYIGGAQKGLRHRFKKYQSHINKGTVAVRLRSLIAEALRNGAKVATYYATPPAVISHWNKLPIDGIAGLEEGLIRNIRPPWNNRGLRSLLDEVVE
jgi:hypothetical protein